MTQMRETITLSAQVRDAQGERLMLHASFDERTLNLHMEVLDAAYVEANAQTVRAEVAAFIAAACARAAESGLPIGEVKAT